MMKGAWLCIFLTVVYAMMITVRNNSHKEIFIPSFKEFKYERELKYEKEFNWKRLFGIISPFIVPKYRIVFVWNAKAACTFWKQVFQYLHNQTYADIHHKSGLLYFYRMKKDEIIRILENDTWTKVTVVREPRDRILSAYLFLKSLKHNYFRNHCRKDVNSFTEFITLIQKCYNPHWQSQVQLPIKYYKNMIIGKMENIGHFTKELLSRIGEWNNKTQNWLSSKLPFAHENMQLMLHHICINITQNLLKIKYHDYELFGFDKTYISRH